MRATPAATAVPTITGTTAAGSVRGRAPASHMRHPDSTGALGSSCAHAPLLITRAGYAPAPRATEPTCPDTTSRRRRGRVLRTVSPWSRSARSRCAWRRVGSGRSAPRRAASTRRTSTSATSATATAPPWCCPTAPRSSPCRSRTPIRTSARRRPTSACTSTQRWNPPWPHESIVWPDFGVPAEPGPVVASLQDALDRARSGERVEIGCLGGHGRTGTALAASPC